MSRVRTCALAVVMAAGTLLASGASGSAAGASVGVSPNGGTVAYGYISEALGRGSSSFEMMLGVPAAGAVSSPESSVDLSKPWALFREWTTPAGNTGTSVSCDVQSNPASWGLQTSAGPASAWFDAACNDGSPYAFYRIGVTQWGPSWESSYVSPLNQQWGAMLGSPAQAAVNGEQGASYDVGNLQVCGYLAAPAPKQNPWVCGEVGGYGYISPMVAMTTTLFDQ